MSYQHGYCVKRKMFKLNLVVLSLTDRDFKYFLLTKKKKIENKKIENKLK